MKIFRALSGKGGFFSIITAISSLPAKTPNGDGSYFYMKKAIQYSCEQISNNDSVDSQDGVFLC